MIREHPAGCTLAVRAQPGAKKTAITGIYGEGDQTALKIALHAPPIEGRANEALKAFLAEILDLPKSNVQLLSGESSRSKRLLIKGLTSAEVEIAFRATLQAGHLSGTE
jgi:hypothetical protein